MWVVRKSSGAPDLDHVVEEVRDPARRRGRRAADEQPGVDALDGLDGEVVELEVLVARAGPEDLEVGLVPDLEAPARDLVDAVALDEVLGQVAAQRAPRLPVVGHADAGAVLEHRRFRIRGELPGHERELDHRRVPQFEHAVVDGVDRREVVGAEAVDAEIVVEDRVGADARRAELVAGQRQRLGELLADPGRVELGQPLGADHVPEAVELPAVAVDVHLRGRRPARPRSPASPRRRPRAGRPRSRHRPREATAYQRSTPGSPVVSAYAGPGCARTSREWWSSGVHGPSGPGAWWTRYPAAPSTADHVSATCPVPAVAVTVEGAGRSLGGASLARRRPMFVSQCARALIP